MFPVLNWSLANVTRRLFAELLATLAGLYQKLDPCNCFNPGIGNASKFAAYRKSQSE
ncbi:hypothetical protein V4C52_36255 [Paraburkholderia azotifigens]